MAPRILRMPRYNCHMEPMTQSFKHTVTALLAGVWFSLPLQAHADDLDDLFAQLAVAGEGEHSQIAREILRSWEKSGSASMDLLLRRASDAMEDGLPEVAVDHFTALIDHAPDFAEGYHGRASAYYALDLIGPALDDLRQVLVLEPRQFDAMFGLGVIMEGLEQPQNALDVYQMILEIYPFEEKALEAVARLTLQLEGQAI